MRREEKKERERKRVNEKRTMEEVDWKKEIDFSKHCFISVTRDKSFETENKISMSSIFTPYLIRNIRKVSNLF